LGAEHASVWQLAQRGSEASYPALETVASLVRHRRGQAGFDGGEIEARRRARA
jgi:hypothetical protein